VASLPKSLPAKPSKAMITPPYFAHGCAWLGVGVRWLPPQTALSNKDWCPSQQLPLQNLDYARGGLEAR